LRHSARLQRSSELDHPLGRALVSDRLTIFLRCSVQDNVLHPLTQGRIKLVVNPDHAGVDDPHGHARLDGVIEEYRVYRFARRVVATETERHIRHAA
jgi:hypothetical protein